MRRAAKHRGKKACGFVSDPDTLPTLVVWAVVASLVMNLHQHLFRVGKVINRVPGQCAVLDFCSKHRSYPWKLFRQLSTLLIPDAPGHEMHWRVLYILEGNRWSAPLLRKARTSVLIVSGNLWRRILLFFLKWPWRLGDLLDPSISFEDRLALAEEFCDTELCCMGMSARQIRMLVTCGSDLMTDEFLAFLEEMFMSMVLSTAFIECMFASFRQWLLRSAKTISAATLASKHVTNCFHNVWSATWRKVPQGRERRKAEKREVGKLEYRGPRSRPIWAQAKRSRTRLSVGQKLSARAAFISHYLARDHKDDLTPQQRMKQAVTAWNAISDDDKARFAIDAGARNACSKVFSRDVLQEFLDTSGAASWKTNRRGCWGAGDDLWPLAIDELEAMSSERQFVNSSHSQWEAEVGRVHGHRPGFPSTLPAIKGCADYLPCCKVSIPSPLMDDMKSFLRNLKLVFARHGGKIQYGGVLEVSDGASLYYRELCSCRKVKPFQAELLKLERVTGSEDIDMPPPFDLKLKSEAHDDGPELELQTEIQFAHQVLTSTHVAADAVQWRLCEGYLTALDTYLVTACDVIDFELLSRCQTMELTRRAALLAWKKSQMTAEQYYNEQKRPRKSSGRGSGRGRGKGKGKGRGKGGGKAATKSAATASPKAKGKGASGKGASLFEPPVPDPDAYADEEAGADLGDDGLLDIEIVADGGFDAELLHGDDELDILWQESVSDEQRRQMREVAQRQQEAYARERKRTLEAHRKSLPVLQARQAATEIVEDLQGYLTMGAAKIGRVAPQLNSYHVQCSWHSSCSKWVNARDVVDPVLLRGWVAMQKKYVNAAKHKEAFDWIVKAKK